MNNRTEQCLAARGSSFRTWPDITVWRLVAVLMAFASITIHACGPGFPNWLLDGDDYQILSAPVASFAEEIRKLDLPVPPHAAIPSAYGQHASDTRDAELADLTLALAEAGMSSETASAVVAAHAVERQKLLDYLRAHESWHSQFGWISNNAVPPPTLPSIDVVAGLPAEFADYFRGAIAWQTGDTNGARQAWAALLERPAAERQFKSTWAAYMLGRSWEDTRPGKAERYYQLVRRYADEGLADSAGLAAASLGREALIHYRAGDPAPAIKLYLQQAAAGDPGALISLRFTAADALQKRHRSLNALARDSICRRVVTAYLISSLKLSPVHLDGVIRETAINTLAKIKYFKNSTPSWHRYGEATQLWLEAVESAEIDEAEEAELLALAAYQVGEFETAARWLMKAPENTLSLWLRAKLLLHDGEVAQAAACLSVIVQSLRGVSGVDAELQPLAGTEGFGFAFWSAQDSMRQPTEEVLGELGALLLVQGFFTEALDALLRAGFWMDAAYMAERVLTVEELKSYVELNWPEPEAEDYAVDGGYRPSSYWQTTSKQAKALEIRYLLARRLARLDRRTVAQPFFPKSLRPQFDTLNNSLALGRNEAASKVERAAALWSAAQILRTNGLELIGTEVGPDWAVHGGNFEVGVTASERTNSLALPPTADELTRAQQHGVSPERRWHYRDRAADVAWEAAALMPNNTDETADVLYTAGCWLKNWDPQAADRFYKALVNRCRQTALGKAADEKRWFPSSDEMLDTR